LNQLPVIDQRRKADVFWVGLSAVAFADDEERLPLSPFTRSGALVADIEERYRSELTFYKTNLVKCLPLKLDKIRYPLQHEMEKCYPNLESEIKELEPSVVFLLGKLVAGFVLEKVGIHAFDLDENFTYRVFQVGNIAYVPVHHPSFVLVYKRKQLKKYISKIQSVMLKQTEALAIG